jgi:hypothetical protein
MFLCKNFEMNRDLTPFTFWGKGWGRGLQKKRATKISGSFKNYRIN